MTLETYHITVSGSFQGEDRVDILRLPIGVAMIMACGQRGNSGGAEAAALVVENVVNFFVHADDDPGARAFVQLLSDIDQALATDEIAGRTSAVVALVTDDGFIEGAIAGEAHLCLVRAENAQSLAGRPRKPLLGTGAAMPEPFTAELGAGTLLMATQALWKRLGIDRIGEIVRAADTPLDGIAHRLIDGGGHNSDDIGIAVCRMARRSIL